MSIWIDHKYAGLLSPRLTRFKQKSKDTYNFRCPICLDSKISEKKARGWLFTTANALRFFCHNCGASLSFRNFLKEVDVNLFDEYQKEKFMEDNFVQAKSKELDVDKFKTYIPKILRNKSPLRDLKKVSQLPVEHKFKKYITSRKIPPNHHFRLFYCPKFKEWVNSFIPNKFNNVEKDSSRLIIPFIDSDGKFFGCQGRSLRNGDIRYITIMLDESIPKIFGLDTCDLTQFTYIFEGPIDSLFIENSIAMCGSDISASIDINKDKSVFVFDNEPRNINTVKKIDKYIDRGYNVCIWPSSIKQKDINDMILAGCEPEELKIIIDKNTYRGINAKLNLTSWKRC